VKTISRLVAGDRTLVFWLGVLNEKFNMPRIRFSPQALRQHHLFIPLAFDFDVYQPRNPKASGYYLTQALVKQLF
jgi:hypothetical protein